MKGNLFLFEEFGEEENETFYRGISKQEVIKACDSGTLTFRSADGKVSLTKDIDIANDHSNYVVEVECDNVEEINGEYKANDPGDCFVILIYEFDTKGDKIGEYGLDDFLNILKK